MNELRWILLAAGALALILIYWQGRRKRLTSSRAPLTRDVETRELDEPAVLRRREAAIPILPQAAVLSTDDLPEVRVHAGPIPNSTAALSTPALSMEEALSTAALDRLTITQPLNAAGEPLPTPMPRPVVEARPPTTPRPSAASTAPRTARKIVALRVPAVSQPFGGARLKDAFFAQDLHHGRYNIYHRLDPKGVPVFSVASIVEPGTFDPATMADHEYLGVSLFLQLPGPIDGIAAFDAMLECARSLQETFAGSLQGERGKALTDDAIFRTREEIADFQHLTRTQIPAS